MICPKSKESRLSGRAELSEILGRAHQTIPIVANVFRGTADLGHHLGGHFGGNHFDGVPGTNLQIVGIRFLAGNVDANFAADAALDVDLAPLVRALDNTAVDLQQANAVDRADFETRLATGAVIGVDDRQLFGNFFTWTSFGHGSLR